MIVTIRWAIPFIILAVVFLPLPFAIILIVFGALPAVRPRGEPAPAGAAIRRPIGPVLLRSPPR